MRGVLAEIDNYDLYGEVAYPKRHLREEVGSLYRWVAAGGGVFVNCALGEPFGLTLLEAAAHGVPVIATKEGGPADIVRVLANGTLVDPTDPRDICRGILEVLLDKERWAICSQNGRDNIHKFTWGAHTEAYINHLTSLEPPTQPCAGVEPGCFDGMLVCDLDHTLLGASGGLPRLLKAWERIRETQRKALVVATGRDLVSASVLLRDHGVAWDALVANGGSELWHNGGEYGGTSVGDGGELSLHPAEPWEDEAFGSTVSYGWDARGVRAALAGVLGLCAQPEANQSSRKVCYYITVHCNHSRHC